MIRLGKRLLLVGKEARETVANYRAVPSGGADSCLPADWKRTLGAIYRLPERPPR